MTMNAVEIYRNAVDSLNRDEITIGEFEAQIAVLKDVEPVVRCKDCKLAVVAVPPFVAEQKLVCTKAVNWRAVEPNHFCSYGERREGE